VFTYVQNAAGPILKDENCSTPGCGDKWFSAGKLRLIPKFEGHYVCSTNPTHTFGPQVEKSAAGPGVWGGQNCPNCTALGGAGTLGLEQVTSELYRCDTCNFEGWYGEPGAPAARGSHQNQACPRLCGGKMQSKKQPLANQPRVELANSAPGAKVNTTPSAALPHRGCRRLRSVTRWEWRSISWVTPSYGATRWVTVGTMNTREAHRRREIPTTNTTPLTTPR
jgi:hypothetical protein